MSNEIPSILSHVSIGTNQFEAASRFYCRVLSALEIKVMHQAEGAIAFGRQFPEFWLQQPINGQPATTGNGSHFSFIATSKEQVDRFYQVAIAEGGTDAGEPGPRPCYGEPYYGCFVYDLDGHKIEANFWDFSLGNP